MKKVYLETFGCQMNVLDSELVESQLRTLGYTFTPVADEAQVVLYNTCSVRELAEQKVLSRLGRVRQRKERDPSLIVGVIGCMAERDGVGMLKRLPHVDLMCGPSELDQLPLLLENVYLTGRQQSALAGNTSRRTKTMEAAEEDGLELLDLGRSFSPERTSGQAYIRIVRGCNKFCTYCVVPYTRGAEVSRSPGAIVEEARKLVDAGVMEITLLGQTVNHYVYEEPGAISTPGGPGVRRTTFAELLKRVHDEVPGLRRLRFLTSYPADFGDDILQVMAESPRICNFLHVPAQSGSDRLLKLMNRGYTVEQYLDLLERARRILPDVVLAGDIIVGFPTETEEDFAATCALIEKARYKNCYIFKYSPRPGTVAIKRFEDDVPEETKRARNNAALAVQNRISLELNRELVGQTVEVLCEGPSGWKEPESVVAGASRAGTVELGATLAAGVRAGQKATVRAGTIGESDQLVQMTGRTQGDQIVVFPGRPEWRGRLLELKVREAHGMTIFADVVMPKQATEWATASSAAGSY